jgi:hypothetical protein
MLRLVTSLLSRVNPPVGYRCCGSMSRGHDPSGASGRTNYVLESWSLGELDSKWAQFYAGLSHPGDRNFVCASSG